MIRALLQCDSLGKVTMRELLEYKAGKRVKPPAIDITDNVLTATAQVDSLEMMLQLKDYYEYYYGRNESTVTETIEVEVNRLSWWQKLWIACGKVCTPALIITLLLIIRRKFK